MTSPLLVHSLFILVAIPFLGALRNNVVFLVLTKAEYKSIVTTIAEVKWICSLLTELDISLPQQPIIYCDNVGVMSLSANLVFHSYMKHVALNYHFICEQV